MTDPLAETVTLLQPGAPLSKLVSGAGAWRVHRPASGEPFYCVVLEGGVRLDVDGHDPLGLTEGDFVLIPAVSGFTMSGGGTAGPDDADPLTVTMLANETRHGDPSGPANARLLIGHFTFGSPDAALLVSLLPQLVHVRGEQRLSAIVALVAQEAREQRPARNVVLAKLMEVLLIEALRSISDASASPGLLRGLADARLATAIRRIHENPAQNWTIEQLAREAALSRSAFFARFDRAMGVAPMEYLLSWRMALAKNLLRRGDGNIAEIAERIGYGSANTFSAAFTRFVGVAPSLFARGEMGSAGA